VTWEIKPFASVGPMQFGQSRTAIRSVLGAKYDTFEKVPGAIPTDAYDELGVHAYYDESDRLCLVELFEPASASIDSVELLESDVATVLEELQDRGIERQEVDNGYKYDELGFVVVVMDGEIDGVSVFKKGYYD